MKVIPVEKYAKNSTKKEYQLIINPLMLMKALNTTAPAKKIIADP